MLPVVPQQRAQFKTIKGLEDTLSLGLCLPDRLTEVI